MEPMSYTTAVEAMALVRQGELALLRRCKISLNFTWGEMLINRSDATIQAHFKLAYAQNLVKLAAKLEQVRSWLGNRSIAITSGWRDRARQAQLVKQGTGATKSRHLIGQAVDIQVNGMTPLAVFHRLKSLWVGGLGNGSRLGFTHLDDRGFKVPPFDYS
jgi:hypothetical protein